MYQELKSILCMKRKDSDDLMLLFAMFWEYWEWEHETSYMELA